jgi:hypothetical protein
MTSFLLFYFSGWRGDDRQGELVGSGEALVAVAAIERLQMNRPLTGRRFLLSHDVWPL